MSFYEYLIAQGLPKEKALEHAKLIEGWMRNPTTRKEKEHPETFELFDEYVAAQQDGEIFAETELEADDFLDQIALGAFEIAKKVVEG